MRPLIVLLLLLVAQVWSLSVPPSRSYERYSVYRVRPASPSQQRVVDQLLEQHDMYNLWHRSNNEDHIMVHPGSQKSFRKIMQDANIDVELMIPNVQKLIYFTHLLTQFNNNWKGEIITLE